MRLFVAINFDETLRAALRQTQEAMRRGGVRGRYSPEENLHLTLAFIGKYPRPEDVLDAMDAVPFEPFDLALQGMGAFGDLWWAGLEDSAPLQLCARRLRHALSDAGIPFDRKRFSPHITLIRRAECGPKGFPAVEPPRASMRVERMELMRSDFVRGGTVYTPVR